MKNKILLITAVLFLSVLFLNAQENKKIQVKVIKSENGETIKLDTTFESTEHGDIYFYSDGKINKEKIDSILKSLDIDGDHSIQFISKNLDDIDSDKVKHIWISKTGDDEFDLDKHAIIEMIDGEKIIETTNEFTIIGDDSLKVKKEYIYVVGNDKVYESKDGKKVLISKSAHSKAYVWNENKGDSDVRVITITDDMDVDVNEKGHVKVISTLDDNIAVSEIIIKKGDGDTKTIEVIVDEDEFDDKMMVELQETLEGSGETVKIVKYKTGEGKYVVKADITDEDFKKENSKKLSKVKIIQDKEKNIFKIELLLEKKETIQIHVEDSNGKKVYSKKIKKFNGTYSGEIDLSKEQDGVYYLEIIQGDKTIAKKELKK
ncbi:MAG: T9SS type A sorting domain-containing protein [Bacteroidales bacterium]|nr:T9SS type A sorting domain-containing protein [Bacteroidales bacterium]